MGGVGWVGRKLSSLPASLVGPEGMPNRVAGLVQARRMRWSGCKGAGVCRGGMYGGIFQTAHVLPSRLE